MTTTMAHVDTPQSTPYIRGCAQLCVAAGLLGAASGVFLIVVSAEVPDDRYSYPLSAGAFAAIQVWFFVQHLGLLAGQDALRRTGAAGSGRVVAAGHWLALGGMALLAVTELAAIAAADVSAPTTTTGVLDGLYGLSTIAIGVGLVVVGIGVRRTRSWSGWRAWVPLVVGVWVFVPMTPAIMAGYLPARLSITAWMLLYAALGAALLSAPRRALDEPDVVTPGPAGTGRMSSAS